LHARRRKEIGGREERLKHKSLKLDVPQQI
jgi:hypothetical protein